MPADVKKMLIRIQCEILYGCAYVYGQPAGEDWSYRFYFNIFGSSRMWSCVRELKSRGLAISIFRPPV